MGRPGYVLGNAKTSVSCDQELYEGFADSNTVYNEDRLIMTVIYVLQ